MQMMNQEIKEQLEEIVNQLNGEIKYYRCFNLKEQHRKIEIIYEKTIRKK